MYSDIVRNRLIEERKKAGYTQRDIAEQLNIPPSKIAKIETGSQAIDIETIGKLADFYGVSVSWLFGLGQKELPGKAEQSFIDEIASGTFMLSLLASLSKEEMKVFLSGQMKYSRFLQDEKFKSLSQKQQIYLYQEYQNKRWEEKQEESKNWPQSEGMQQPIKA